MPDVTPLGLTADPEQINRWLANAILESALGKTIRAKAEAALKSYDFTREIEGAIRNMVLEEARNLISKDEALRANIAAALTQALQPELIDKLVTEATAKLARTY